MLEAPMIRKCILTGAALLWVALGTGAGAGQLWAAPQDQQQKSASTQAEYNAYKAAGAAQNPQQKIKQLDDFVKHYPNSPLMPYIYRDYYLTDLALRNFAGTMEYADRVVALGDKVGIQERLDALVARAQAYDVGSNDKTLQTPDVQTKALDAAALGLKTLHDWKKPDAMAKDQYAQQVKGFKVLFNSVAAAASRAAEASSAMAELNAPRVRQEMQANQAIESKTRGEQAEFEQRKKQAVDLGMKPGTTEYVEYVATGKVVTTPGQATVHFTSSPSGGEIFIDGKFVGNTPSDIALAVGEHAVKVAVRGKEWSRTIEITGGEISVHAEIPTGN
jgi:PEGA domain